jgi:hypothetical protein
MIMEFMARSRRENIGAITGATTIDNAVQPARIASSRQTNS